MDILILSARADFSGHVSAYAVTIALHALFPWYIPRILCPLAFRSASMADKNDDSKSDNNAPPSYDVMSASSFGGPRLCSPLGTYLSLRDFSSAEDEP